MKHKLKKCLSLLLAGVMIMGLLSGCGRQSLELHAKKQLKEKYGEEFGIKTVYKDGSTVIAYPVSDPNLLFKAYYVKKGKGFDHYLQALVEKQFKELIEEKFKDFEYDYYIDVNVGRINLPGADTDITIEEHDKLTEGTSQYSPGYRIFLSYDSLSLQDDELYRLLESIANMHDCGFTVYFILNDDFDVILKDYSSYPTLSSDTYHYLNETRKYKAIHSSTDENGKWKMTFEEFQETMTEVRNNELF